MKSMFFQKAVIPVHYLMVVAWVLSVTFALYTVRDHTSPTGILTVALSLVLPILGPAVGIFSSVHPRHPMPDILYTVSYWTYVGSLVVAVVYSLVTMTYGLAGVGLLLFPLVMMTVFESRTRREYENRTSLPWDQRNRRMSGGR